jgi:hypothetical protein
MFDPATWGTVGQWVGSIGTTLAFTATFYVIRRDAKVRRYAQARKVAFYQGWTTVEVDAVTHEEVPRFDRTVQNLSDEPIYDVRIWKIGDTTRSNTLEKREVLLPNGPSLIYRCDSETGERIFLDFRDNSGKRWTRTLRGNLSEIDVLSFGIRLRIRFVMWLFKLISTLERIGSE